MLDSEKTSDHLADRRTVIADDVPNLDRAKMREELLSEFDRVTEEVSHAMVTLATLHDSGRWTHRWTTLAPAMNSARH